MKPKHIYDANFIYTPAAKQKSDHLREKFKKIQAEIDAEKERSAKVCGEIKPKIRGKS